MNQWNPKSDLKAALTALAEMVPLKPSSRLAKNVATAEKALGFSLPSDLRALYEVLPPQQPDEFLGEPGIVRIYPVEEVHLWHCEFASDADDDFLPWVQAKYFVFGATVDGDELFYNTSDGAPVCRGAILVTNHEGAPYFIVLAHSLADWLARFAAYTGLELAIMPGDIENVPGVDGLAFAEDHLRLNPDAEWAARKIYSERHPHSNALIYWDDRERRLRPLEEMTWLESVTLDGVKPPDLMPLAALKELNHLVLSRCDVADLSPLASCEKLEWLGMQDGPDTSVAPLAAIKKLEQLRVGRMLLMDVAALAAIPALDFLEITDCAFEDVVSVAAIASLTKLDLSGTQIKTLAPLLALKGLTYLQIDDTQVTDLSPATELPHLKSLIVSKGAFPKKVLDDIRRRRPGLELSEW